MKNTIRLNSKYINTAIGIYNHLYPNPRDGFKFDDIPNIAYDVGVARAMTNEGWIEKIESHIRTPNVYQLTPKAVSKISSIVSRRE